MKYSKIAILFTFINLLGCLPSISVGEGFQVKGKKYSDVSEFKSKKVYLDLTYEYGIIKEETKTKSGKIEKKTDRATPEVYLQFRDALFYELRGKYKLDVEFGLPKAKDSLFISVTPRMDMQYTTVEKASIILNKGQDPLYKLDIVNAPKIQTLKIEYAKTVEQLAEISAEKIFDAIIGKSE
ncbi:hypothetical protein ACQV5M_00125 [Leptospira sp. SA-E8]|uniref:hypothetical protein n=1 Tax=Leptospira sp. SA-E8 TaxID=3422259 RepID=UPI003EBB4DAF